MVPKEIAKRGHPGPNFDVKIDGFTVRLATMNDLKAIDQLARTVNWGIGLHNLKLYMETSGNTWTVVVNESEEVVASDSYNALNGEGVFMGYQIIVREDCRGLKLSRLFNSMDRSTFALLGNATTHSIQRYMFEKYEQKLGCFLGHIPWNLEKLLHFLPMKSDIELRTIDWRDEDSFDKLMSFDAAVLGMDRSTFLKKWCGADGVESKTVLAIDTSTGSVVGSVYQRVSCKDLCNIYICIFSYGVRRLMDRCYTISPLYAQNDALAWNLLLSLVCNMEAHQLCYMLIVLSRQILVKFVNQIGWQLDAVEFRNVDSVSLERVQNKIQWPSVYCMHDYWPA